MQRTITINTTFIEKYWHRIAIALLLLFIYRQCNNTDRLKAETIAEKAKTEILLKQVSAMEKDRYELKRLDAILAQHSEQLKAVRQSLKDKKYEKTAAVDRYTPDELELFFSERYNKDKPE